LILPPRQSCVGFSEQSFFWPWMFPEGRKQHRACKCRNGCFRST
jgi:hypothetical protein